MKLINKTTVSDQRLLQEIEKLWPNEDCKFIDGLLKERDGIRYSAMMDADIDKVIEVTATDIGRESMGRFIAKAIRLEIERSKMHLVKGYDGLCNHRHECACEYAYRTQEKGFWTCFKFNIHECRFAVKRKNGTMAEYEDDEFGYVPEKVQ